MKNQKDSSDNSQQMKGPENMLNIQIDPFNFGFGRISNNPKHILIELELPNIKWAKDLITWLHHEIEFCQERHSKSEFFHKPSFRCNANFVGGQEFWDNPQNWPPEDEHKIKESQKHENLKT